MKSFTDQERVQVDAELARRRRTMLVRMFAVLFALVAFAVVFATSVAIRMVTYGHANAELAQALRAIGQAMSLPS